MEKPFLSHTISSVGKAIQQKRVSVTEMVAEALNQIDALNSRLNAVITINPKALEQAEKMDKQIAAGHQTGPLHGIPIGLKDMIDTQDMKTTMGSPIYKDHIPAQDAHVVSQLRQAGAMIIGKLNTHQFAYGPTGDRSYYGAIHNSYDLSRMAGGSSGGSAAAVATGLCFGALGTDTSGSIRVPAAFCGIVGMKPSNGRVHQQGIFPLSQSLDNTGPMTKTVYDNALLMNALSQEPQEDFTRLIGKDLQNITIGIPDAFYFDNLNPDIERAVNRTIDTYAHLGVNLRTIHIPHMETFLAAQKVIIAYESRRVHETNLKKYPDMWDDEVQHRLLNNTPSFEEYEHALDVQQQAKNVFQQELTHLQAILTPTTPILPPKINERSMTDNDGKDADIRSLITKLTAPTNLNGLPSLTLPSGLSASGLPIGVQLIGNTNSEALLYQIGHALEETLALDMTPMDV